MVNPYPKTPYRGHETPGPVFIALSGKKQVGKDTATGMLENILRRGGLCVQTTAFAKALKEMCINVLGLKRECVYGTNEQKDSYCNLNWDTLPLDVRIKYSHSVKPKLDVRGVPYNETTPRVGPMTVREVLQVVGTDIFRNMLYGNVWAEAPFKQDWQGVDVVIITDCRFPNEKLATEEHGGVIIRLERNTGFSDNHTSEIALDDHTFEHRYENNGSLEELETFLRSVLVQKGIVNG